ncbi:hypothetical protein Bca101_089228 [Brassica carinata]
MRDQYLGSAQKYVLSSSGAEEEEEAGMELVPWEMRIWKCDWLNQLKSGYAKAYRRRTRLVIEASEAKAYDLTSIYLPGRSSSPQLHEIECSETYNFFDLGKVPKEMQRWN